MEERFGDTIRGLPRAGGASVTVNSITTDNVSGMTKKQGLLETSTWEETVFLSKRSKLSLK